MKIEPRRAEARDWPWVADTFIAAREAMAFLPNLHTRTETRAFIKSVTEMLEVWVVEASAHDDGRIAGFAAIHDTENGPWLDHLYIHPAMQNHALGQILLDIVKTQRPQGFSLWTFQQNSGARRFYERQP